MNITQQSALFAKVCAACRSQAGGANHNVWKDAVPSAMIEFEASQQTTNSLFVTSGQCVYFNVQNIKGINA